MSGFLHPTRRSQRNSQQKGQLWHSVLQTFMLNSSSQKQAGKLSFKGILGEDLFSRYHIYKISNEEKVAPLIWALIS